MLTTSIATEDLHTIFYKVHELAYPRKDVGCWLVQGVEEHYLIFRSTTQKVREATGHLRSICAVMGCIVNGPGEMADADFGYVGSGPGKMGVYVLPKIV